MDVELCCMGINTDTCRPLPPSSPSCLNRFEKECIYQSSDSMYTNRWSKNSFCNTIVRGNLDPNNLPWMQQQMNQLFTTYFANGIQPPASAGSFQRLLYLICRESPSACSLALTNTCSRYTRTQIESNATLTNYCGCYLSPDQYAQYTNFYGIQQQCDPLCARSETIPPLEPCASNQCIIDNVTINLVGSTSGSINFNQLCGGCTFDQQCQCYLNDVSINVVESTVGNIDLVQRCQGGLSCFDVVNNEVVEVPCSGNPVAPSPVSNENINVILIVIYIVIGMLVCIVILIGIVAIFTKKTERSTVPLKYISD